MQDALYNSLLRDKGITPVIPDAKLCDEIHNLIIDQIIPSKINPNVVTAIGEKIKQLNCDAVLLGCTELPLVYDDQNLVSQ